MYQRSSRFKNSSKIIVCTSKLIVNINSSVPHNRCTMLESSCYGSAQLTSHIMFTVVIKLNRVQKIGELVSGNRV